MVARRGHRPRIAAVVADQAVDLGVLDQGNRTAQALHRFSAVAAHHIGRHPATVQIKDHLLFVLERAFDHIEQPLRKRLTVAGRELIAHVDQLDLGVVAAHPARQLRQRQVATLRVVVSDDARCRRARDQLRPADSGQPARDPTRLIPRRAVLLVRSRSLFVQADQAESRNRREHRRPAAQDDVSLAPAHPPPLLGALQLGELAVQDRDRRVQAISNALDELRRQRDFRHQQQHA